MSALDPRMREDLQILRAASPEAATRIEAAVLELESDRSRLADNDAFRAFVLQQAKDSGAAAELLRRIDSSILSTLVEAKLLRDKTALIEANREAAATKTRLQVLTEPVVLAVVGVVSTLVGGLVGLLSRYGVTGGP